ncbi:MAG: NAD(P)-dependent oxidoreductase [Verrucomicrobia bacterium]|nr:NAD(P)-dependent oxidoreductase [Verrucomicrobiota bacterium]
MKGTILPEKMIICPEDLILVTGAAGFIGSKLVEILLERGFRNLRCFARPSSNSAKLKAIVHRCGGAARVEIITGNLLSREDCIAAAKDVTLVYHLAAGRGQKMYADAYMNSVVTTRNLIEGCLHHHSLRRFVSISSFSVYSNTGKPGGRLLDESCPVEEHPELRGDAYAFAKVKQDELVAHYRKKFGVPAVIVRPGYVYGPGNEGITGRVGIGTFGIFLHLGGSNRIPLTFVDNCAEAIVLAGLKQGVDGEIFNVVDDDLPSSREFLRLYKRHVRRFPSVYLPHMLSYLLCYLWEKYSQWSEGQLPPVYSRKEWHTAWKPTRYTNEKLKSLLGWMPRVSSREGLCRFFESCKQKGRHA